MRRRSALGGGGFDVGWLAAVAPQLEAVGIDAGFDRQAFQSVWRLLVGPDDAEDFPGCEAIGQTAALGIAREAEQAFRLFCAVHIEILSYGHGLTCPCWTETAAQAQK